MPTVASLTPVTDWPVLIPRWPHLSDLPVTKSGGRVDILIELDYGQLTAVIESREEKEMNRSQNVLLLAGWFGE
jgi:hypothetical protein